jgi:hypothetical protein
MELPERRTLRNGAIGGVVGSLLGFVPIVLLVAPLLGGGVAGYLEGDGARSGAIAGAIAGAIMAALGTILTGTILFLRFGELPFDGLGVPLGGLLIGAVLSIVATVGQLLVAAIGGGLGGILEADRRATREDTAVDSITEISDTAPRSWVPLVVSLVAGFVTLVVVGLSLTIVLEPVIWLSILVGLPAGIIAGTAVAVLTHHMLTRPAGDRVSWRTVGAGALAVVLLFGLVLAGLSVLGEQRIDVSTSSTYEYRVSISADETLEDVTFYVPVPVEGNSSRLGEAFVETVQYYRYTPPVRGYDGDPTRVEFTYDLVETQEGTMLAISADRIPVETVYYRNVENETGGYYERIDGSEYDPDDPSMGVQNDGSFEFTVSIGANETIDTATPIGDEPLFPTRHNQTEVSCFGRDTETNHCYEYDGRVYAEYDTDTETNVFVAAEVNGRNEWFAGGWRGNEYREYARLQMSGPQSGWYVTDGELEIGNGVYRE